MLGKLMKYEFKSTGRILFPLYGVLLLFTLINKIFMRSDLSGVNIDILNGIPAVISIFAYACTMAAVFIVTFFIVIQRFYKNILGDEGYLMHTLPVEPWKNILSKLLVAVIWTIVSAIVAVVSIFILALSSSVFNSNIFSDLGIMFTRINEYWGINFYVAIIEVVIAGLSQITMGIVMIYASISIGHLFNKRRILASFGAFIGLNIIMNTILSILSYVFATNFNEGINITFNSINQVHGIFIGAIVINMIFLGCYFLITNYIIKNRLNLE